jgi:hypothetical protein
MWCAAICLAGASLAAGQTYQGGVRGLVRDANGVVPAAEVTLINEETNAIRTITTNEVGEYSFPDVLPATYAIKVAMIGFRTEERKGLRIGTSQVIVADFSLQVGTVAEEVTVTGEAPLIERSNPTVAASLEFKTLETMPVFGRNAFYLAISTPNVIQSGDPQFVRLQDQSNASFLSLGGGPRRGNGYLLEGVPITDFTNRPILSPSIEAIEDLKVQVKTYDADMGHTAGGVFNTVAKSGSNTWHGSAFIIDKPEWATGELYFAQMANLPKPPAYYYDWGGSLGGPIVQDKTFFFYSMEGYQDETTRNNVLTFPTSAMRSGDFSGLVNAAGQKITIYDPMARDSNGNRLAFPNNNINQRYNAATGTWSPLNRINPVAAAILKTMPLPTAGESFNGNATLVDGPQDQETIKIDQRWNSKWTTTGMYAHQHTFEPGSAFFGSFNAVAGDPGSSSLYRTIQFIALNNIFVPNNTTAIAIRYGYNRFFDDGGNYPAFDASTLGFPAGYVNQLTYNTYPAMIINGYGGGTAMGNTGPTVTTHVSQVANATISKFVGHHSLKFGGDYRRLGITNISYGASAGQFTFTPAFTQGPNANAASATAGDAFASFLLGYAGSGTVAVAQPGHYYIDYYAGYAQDDYRVSSKLTLNFGLRYDFETGLQEQNNHLTVGFDPNAVFPVQLPGLNLKGGLMYAGQSGYPAQQGQPLHDEFAPRGGFAWSVTDKTAIRGGWGLFWAPTQYPGTSEAALGARGYSAVTSMLTTVDGVTPFNTLSNPFPSGVTQPQGNSQGVLTGAGGVIDFVDQNSRPGYVQQFSVDLQRELPGGNAVTVGYLGSRSRRLSMGGTADATVNINQLDPSYQALGSQLQQLVPNPFYGNPAFGNFSLTPTIARGQLLRPFPQFGDVLAHRVDQARARYDALVAQWNKRLVRGWSVNANYTYSRLMDNQFGESNSYVNRLGSALNNYNLEGEYGYSLLDVPHRLNFNSTWELPFGEGRRWLSSAHGMMAGVLGGWAVTLAGRYQNGFPTQIWQSSNNSNLLGSTQRPNVVPGGGCPSRGPVPQPTMQPASASDG